MITESEIVCRIGCPHAPGYSEALFQLSYSASYKEDGVTKRESFEKDFKVQRDQCYFARFSEGSIVQFGHLPLFAAWTNAVKRSLAHYHVESYWGFHICDAMPTMGYATGHAWPAVGQGYCGNELRLEFEVPLTAIHVSHRYFGRNEHFSKYEIRKDSE